MKEDITVLVRNDIWYVRFNDNGKDRKLSTDIPVGGDRKHSRKLAIEAGRQRREEYFRRAVAPIPEVRRGVNMKTLRPNLHLALQRTWDKNWSQSKSRIVLQHVIPVMQAEIGHWLLAEIDHDMIEGYLDGLARPSKKYPKGLSPSTRNKRRAYIRKTLGDAVQSGLLDKLPAFPQRKQEKNKKLRFITQDEEQRILGWFTKQTADDQLSKRSEWEYLHDLTIFLTDTGFRFSESMKFTLPEGVHPDIDGKFADLDFDVTKNNDGRRVPLTARAQKAVKRMLASSHHARSEVEEVIAKHWDWCSHRFNRAIKALAINNKDTPVKMRVTMHTCRHTCASRLVQRGVPIFTVKEWMGHRNIATTMRYAHLAPTTLSGALAALEGRPVAVGQPLSEQCSPPLGSESTELRNTGGTK